MSGVEIAGLILGAFPLLIHALEHYGKGAKVLTDWWRIQRAYTKCKQDLEYHKILFEDSVEQFLLPLVVDDDELKSLVDDPAGEAWEDEELEERLKERLPKSYTVFLNIMKDINELMETLKKELGVHNPQFVAKVNEHGQLLKNQATHKDLLSKSNFEFQAKRIKFSLKKSSREKLFGKLQDSNDRLRRLLESSDQNTAARRTRETCKPKSVVNRKINEFWRHAKRLHEVLSKAWQCGCATHMANLQLQHRTSDKVEFDVLFNVGPLSTRGGWRETKIKMVSGCIPPNNTNVTINVPQQPGRPVKPVRQVRWNAPASHSAQPPSNQHMVQITDLCSTLSTSHPDCFGFLDKDDYRFVVYPGQQAHTETAFDTVTLQTLLQDHQNSLTRRKRYSIALTLASSYLQLYSTPWLSTPLQKDNVLFLRDSTNTNHLLVDNPYVCREMQCYSVLDTNDAITILGIRLLELCFGTPLEKSSFRQQLPCGDRVSGPALDHAAAMMWSKLVNEEAGSDFADAIEWCLHPKQLSDGSWRKEIWTQVISPLESCYQQIS
jgi:hypothetical protein